MRPSSSFLVFLAAVSLSLASAHAQDQTLSASAVTWTCTGDPCPWGNTSTGHALVWPGELPATRDRLGYTTSEAIYLPAERARGATLTLRQGVANVYAGDPAEMAHRVIGVLRRGETFRIDALGSGEVVSVQGNAPFELDLRVRGSYYPEGEVIQSTHAFWRCALPGCKEPDWTGEVIPWPSWAAYQSNARSGLNSRAVYDGDGNPLYPYMGRWAEGCKVTAHSGVVLIIEWERGKDDWRETRVYPGQTHTISLRPNEDNAMIETVDGEPGFSASLENCDPQPLP
jgi:hypothetical protein